MWVNLVLRKGNDGFADELFKIIQNRNWKVGSGSGHGGVNGRQEKNFRKPRF